MPRRLVRIDKPLFEGWGCSVCAWVFRPSGPPAGESLDEMTANYERQRDTEFAAHICADHGRARTPPG